jgi:hypothetical protein
MINYGTPPASNEIEVTLFGPGYGEAIAVHLGDGAWMMVDSCIDPDSKATASGTYLEQIGVDARQVRSIVASHWHDDHVRGISQLAAKYPTADFVLSTVLNTKEAGAFLAAYSGASSAGLARGSKELFSVATIDSRQLKRLSDICKKLASVDTGFGAVRLRKPIGAPSWNVELFGAAQPL